MRCNVCHGQAVFQRTVFHDSAPTTIKLCEPCAERVDLVEHMHRIAHAESHDAKTAAVDGLLAAMQNAKA
jgi:protein-arginine kinase activator protein McsA